jgi:fructokinase
MATPAGFVDDLGETYVVSSTPQFVEGLNKPPERGRTAEGDARDGLCQPRPERVGRRVSGDGVLARQDRCPVITVIGEAMVTLAPAPGSGFVRASPGGSALTAAIGAARLGYPTALMARLSRDSLGQFLRMHAASNGIDVSASPEADEPTMIAVVATDASAGSTDSLYFRNTASWQWSAAELGWIPASTTVLNLDLLDCCVLPGSTWILRAAARQRHRGAIVCLNVTVKPAVMGSPTRGQLLIDRPVKAADVVVTSLGDISWLYPGRGAEAVARLWLAEGPELVVITCGSDRLVAVRKSGTVLHRATGLHAASVTEFDAAFTGALLGGLHELNDVGVSIGALSTSDLASVLDTATATASRSDTSYLNLATASERR